MARPSLSVVMIARNAAKDLERSLASVRDIADELLLTDTGSTDDTMAVARRMGAVVDEFPWCDDFAAALNHVHARATGDWLLRLDSDEALTPESLEPLRAVMADPSIAACHVLRRDLADAADPDAYTTMWVDRLYRRMPGMKQVGRCHPQVEPSLERLAAEAGQRVTRHAGISLTHWGYTGERRPAKLQRAARLLELELQDRPGRLYYQVELLRTYLLLGEPKAHAVLEQAAQSLRRHVDEPTAPIPHAAMLLETLLQWPASRLPAGYSPALVQALVRRWFPRAAPLIWLLAGQDFQAGNFADAAAGLRRLVGMGEDQSYDHHTSFDPAIVGDQASLNLAACLIKLAELNEAEAVLTPLLSRPAVAESARANLAVIRQLRGETA